MRFLIWSLWTAAAVAYGADNSTSRLLTCEKIAPDAQRLSCYDEVAKGLRSSPPAASAQAAASPATAGSAPPAPATAAVVREFGLPLKPEVAEAVKSVKATVTATHHRANGSLIIELDNGQRWQQLGSADMGLKAGDSVTISRAMFGSFWLAPPNGRGSKVSRLQ